MIQMQGCSSSCDGVDGSTWAAGCGRLAGYLPCGVSALSVAAARNLDGDAGEILDGSTVGILDGGDGDGGGAGGILAGNVVDGRRVSCDTRRGGRRRDARQSGSDFFFRTAMFFLILAEHLLWLFVMGLMGQHGRMDYGPDWFSTKILACPSFGKPKLRPKTYLHFDNFNVRY